MIGPVSPHPPFGRYSEMSSSLYVGSRSPLSGLMVKNVWLMWSPSLPLTGASVNRTRLAYVPSR